MAQHADGRELHGVSVAVDRNFGQISTGAAVDRRGAREEMAFTFVTVWAIMRLR